MDREIFVYIDLHGAPVLVGRLWTRVRKGRESASFEYDASWLDHPERFALEPALTLAPGPFHTLPEKALFGAIGDSAPDRWGRVLMRRAERRGAEKERQTPRTLLEADFLLRVDDEARQGALRFADELGGPFLAPAGGTRIPPLLQLPRLLSASERLADQKEDDEDLQLLVAPGSSLGGARPKAAVRDHDGNLALAKFPRQQDDVDVVLWEAVALALADRAGIAVPEWRVERIDGKPVILIQRFDRAAGQRIPFLSAMSMLGTTDNEMHSYLEIADALRRYGAAAKEDLAQLWRRIVFNVLISNTDDHLRNHGFLYESHAGWRLSPAYDLNPVPIDIRPRVLSLTIDLDDPAASIELALETAEYYGLKTLEATSIAGEVACSISSWRTEAAGWKVHAREIERMSSAFEHEDLGKALEFSRVASRAP